MAKTTTTKRVYDFELPNGKVNTVISDFDIITDDQDNVIDKAGCTDHLAVNFDPEATTDNGTCIYMAAAGSED